MPLGNPKGNLERRKSEMSLVIQKKRLASPRKRRRL
jgi:hypothetical protein